MYITSVSNVHYDKLFYCMILLLGSRAGAIIAACWASLLYMGEDGYIDSTRRIIQTTRHIENRSGLLFTINSLEHILKLFAPHQVIIVCLISAAVT